LDVDEHDRLFGTITCDRAEFIGRNSSLHRPAALARTRLSGRTGGALDPCSAIQVPSICCLAKPARSCSDLAWAAAPTRPANWCAFSGQRRCPRSPGRGASALGAHARQRAGTHPRRSAERAGQWLADIPNAGLPHVGAQRFYQSGGAIGFRDQLQDAMALVHCRPQLLREHLLLCASRQFVEGDVRTGGIPRQPRRAARTFLTTTCGCRWAVPLRARHQRHRRTDRGVPFIEGRPLDPGDDSYYDLPGRSIHSASLYQHAVRAVLHALRFGEHGLP